MIRGEPSGWRCEVRPQSSDGSAPGGSVNASTSISSSASSSSRSLELVVGVATRGLDVVLLHQLAEVLAIDVGLARRVRDVARVAAEQLGDVVALERRDPALLRILERFVQELLCGR